MLSSEKREHAVLVQGNSILRLLGKCHEWFFKCVICPYKEALEILRSDLKAVRYPLFQLQPKYNLQMDESLGMYLAT